MKINWFPGHMAKALRMMKEEVKNVNVIIYVLDARAPLSCLNPKFVEIIKDKPFLFVLNKYDLADEKKLQVIEKQLSEKYNAKIVKLNATKSASGKSIENALRELSADKIQKYKEKGINYMPKAMVIGVPNCGKSTIINNLYGQTTALTGNKPGVTKAKQIVTLASGTQLYDTPGTLWPSFENEKIAVNLALIGSIKDEVLDLNELAYYLVGYLKQNYLNFLNQRYKIDAQNLTELEIIDQIGKNRGMLLKGGEIDFDKVCTLIVNEFRKGLIGKITLD